MKKTFLTLAIIIAVGFTFTSCKNDKKEEVKVEDVKTEVENEMASNVVYQCPMDCEKGKSYTEKGNCPVCKMDLKALENTSSKELSNDIISEESIFNLTSKWNTEEGKTIQRRVSPEIPAPTGHFVT